MVAIKNISSGPRGTWLGGVLVNADPGQVVEADDFAPEWFEETEAKPEPAGDDITAAIDLLDPANDEHSTNAGLPAVDAVSALVGRTVTRAEINAAAPDFMRPAAE